MMVRSHNPPTSLFSLFGRTTPPQKEINDRKYDFVSFVIQPADARRPRRRRPHRPRLCLRRTPASASAGPPSSPRRRRPQSSRPSSILGGWGGDGGMATTATANVHALTSAARLRAGEDRHSPNPTSGDVAWIRTSFPTFDGSTR